jgi:hypothetical protein
VQTTKSRALVLWRPIFLSGASLWPAQQSTGAAHMVITATSCFSPWLDNIFHGQKQQMTGGTVREKEKYRAYEMILWWWWVIDLVVESSLPSSQKHRVRALVESWLFVLLAAAAPRKVFSLSSLLRRVHSPPRLLCRLCSCRCRCSYIPIVATARPSPFTISFLLERKGDLQCYIMIHGIFCVAPTGRKTEQKHITS